MLGDILMANIMGDYRFVALITMTRIRNYYDKNKANGFNPLFFLVIVSIRFTYVQNLLMEE